MALGRNALIAYTTFEGYNFEDAILLSERLVFTQGCLLGGKTKALAGLLSDELKSSQNEQTLTQEKQKRNLLKKHPRNH